MNLLLVDDDPMLLKSLGNLLAARKHTFKTAHNGREALQTMKEMRPDLVICDLQMPEMDGLAFVKLAQIQSPHTPIVLMTGERNLDTAITAFRSGIFDYLKKPIEHQALMNCIERVQKERGNQQ